MTERPRTEASIQISFAVRSPQGEEGTVHWKRGAISGPGWAVDPIEAGAAAGMEWRIPGWGLVDAHLRDPVAAFQTISFVLGEMRVEATPDLPEDFDDLIPPELPDSEGRTA